MKNLKSRNKQEAKASGVSWTDRAWDEYLSWQKDDQNMVKSINQLIEECRRHPFEGTGKPKPLRGAMSGYWSRRITIEHRLVYMAGEKIVYILSCRHHYKA